MSKQSVHIDDETKPSTTNEEHPRWRRLPLKKNQMIINQKKLIKIRKKNQQKIDKMDWLNKLKMPKKKEVKQAMLNINRFFK